MRKLITLAIVLSLSSACYADCDEADEIIKKQDYLIKLMGKRNEDLFQQVMGLQGQLVKEQLDAEHSRSKNIVWGVVGIALGVLAASAVRK